MGIDLDLRSAKKLLDILCGNANRIILAGFGIGPAESTFFEVVKLLRSHEDLKPYAIELISSVMASRNGGTTKDCRMPSELVELLAHEMKWGEFNDLAEERIQNLFGGDRELAISDLSFHVLEAVRDDWEDRHFYRKYSS